jgi:hypothetical protein
LYEGTYSSNALDSIAAGTFPRSRQTHCLRGHELTGSNVYYLKGTREGQRHCVVCHRERQRRIYALRKRK